MVGLNLALALMAAAQAGGDAACADPQHQQAMNQCAARDFEAADAELNRDWGGWIAAAREADRHPSVRADGRPTHEASLREAQRAWLAFRDAHCRYEGYYARGGSLEPLLVSTCRARVTRERIAQLRAAREEQ